MKHKKSFGWALYISLMLLIWWLLGVDIILSESYPYLNISLVLIGKFLMSFIAIIVAIIMGILIWEDYLI